MTGRHDAPFAVRLLAGWLLLVATLVAGRALADQELEVGYVEDLTRATAADVVIRGGAEIPLQLCMPIRQGDTFRLADPAATVSLRLAGRSGPVIVSQANQSAGVAANPAERGFWSGILGWAASSVSVIDHGEQTRTVAAIRGGGDDKLSVPILRAPQVIASGKRPIAVGWVSPDIVAIRLTGKGGRVILKGKGVGGLWSSPAVDLRPGIYRLQLTSADATVGQDVKVVDPASLPPMPDDLTRQDIPGALGQAAQALWRAGQGDAYLLEALQQVAASADAAKPASVVADSLIAGERPAPPP